MPLKCSNNARGSVLVGSLVCIIFFGCVACVVFFVLVVSVVSSRGLSWICCFQLGLGRDAYFLSQILMEMLFIFSITSPWLLAQ